MRLLGLYMGKVALVRKKLVGSAVFLNFVRPLVLSAPAWAENRVVDFSKEERKEKRKLGPSAIARVGLPMDPEKRKNGFHVGEFIRNK